MSRLPEKYRYIVVEGPIGAGKTSLARKLAAVAEAATLLEDPGANPFLQKFYQDNARYALPTQLFFLFQRVNQVCDLGQADMFRQATVADFILDKDPLFARLTLNDDELNLYQQIYNSIKPQSATPDLVIYLQAPTEVLVERVKRRGFACADHARGAGGGRPEQPALARRPAPRARGGAHPARSRHGGAAAARRGGGLLRALAQEPRGATAARADGRRAAAGGPRH